MFDASHKALSGLRCTSINSALTPTAAAARERYGTNSLCPPEAVPDPPSRSSIRVERTSVSLIIGGFEYIRDGERGCDLFQKTGNMKGNVQSFDNAGTGNQY